MQGYAVKAGVRIARGQSILFMDADGATKVSDVEKLETELRQIASGEVYPTSHLGRLRATYGLNITPHKALQSPSQVSR